MVPHPGDHFRVLVDHVRGLQGIGFQVVELAVFEQAPALPQDPRVTPGEDRLGVGRGVVEAGRHAAVVDDQHAIFRNARLSAQDGGEARAVEARRCRRLDSGEVQEGRQDVLDLGQARHVPRVRQAAVRPTDEERHAMAPFPQLGLHPAHAGVEVERAVGAAVVRHEDHDRVLSQPLVLEEVEKPAHVRVDVPDHPQVPAQPGLQRRTRVGELGPGQRGRESGFVLLLGDQRAVRRVRGDVGQEGRSGLRGALHVVDRFVEEDVRAVPLERLPPAVADVGVVEVVVAPEVGNRADVGRGEPHRLVESAVLGPEGVVVAEVPLAEHAGAVTRLGEDVGHRRDLRPQERPAAADVDRAVAGGVHAGQQLSTGRRAHGRDVEVVQAHALAAQAV